MLRTALREGRTVAEVATEQGVDAQVVIDAVVAEVRERVEERVAPGGLTRQQADEVLASAEARAAAFVTATVRDCGAGTVAGSPDATDTTVQVRPERTGRAGRTAWTAPDHIRVAPARSGTGRRSGAPWVSG